MKYLAVIFLSLMFLSSCASKKATNAQESTQPVEVVNSPEIASSPVRMLPKAVIYKTKKDYNNLVPITLDASHTKVISYPAPSDLVNAKPTLLADGYLLDNRGIGVNSVFTGFTYDEYAALPQAPSIEELLASVVDFDPFVEIYVTNDARSSTNGVDYYDAIVKSNFSNCEKIK